MDFIRILDLKKLVSSGSAFLLGARGVGKSFLIKKQFKNFDQVFIINLLRSKERLPLEQDPSKLEEIILASGKSIIIIDEIQKIPPLLDEVHYLIEEYKWVFLLTGSSARKLKKEGVNLLAHRASMNHMLPLTWYEIYQTKGQFDLISFLQLGGIPAITQQRYLYNYIDTYLKEEILQEALIRKLTPFSRFLQISSLANGEIINYSKIGSDAQVPTSTVEQYYQVLIDTYLGYQLLPWKSPKRKAVSSSKFYYFDIGICNALSNISSVESGTVLFGNRFEHFVINEIRAYCLYNKKREEICFWRTHDKLEVDVVIEGVCAIEIKSKENVTFRDLKGLKKIHEEANWPHLLVVSRDTNERIDKTGIKFIYWENFFRKLWKGSFF